MGICGAAVHRVEPNYKTLALLLATLILAVLLVIILELQYPPQFESATSPGDAKAYAAEITSQRNHAGDIPLLSLGSYAEIIERPLFRPNRRPPDPEEAKAEAQQAAAQAQQEQVHIEELFALNGVVVTKNKTVALLQDIKNNKSVRVSEGERVEGWRVERVFPNRVLFSHNGRAESLRLIRNFELASQNSQREERRSARSKRFSPYNN